MATEQADISRKKLEQIELRLYESALHTIADAVNALLRDGVPYTKVVVGGLNAGT